MAATSCSPEHKARAVQAFLSRGTRSVREVSRELGISHSTLFEWVAASSFDTDSEALASTPVPKGRLTSHQDEAPSLHPGDRREAAGG